MKYNQKPFKIINLLSILTLAFNLQGISQEANTNTDFKLVKAAIEDYVMALYETAPERIERSVDPTLRKIGYNDYNGESYDNQSMTYEQLYDLAGKWNKDGQNANAKSQKKIDIYEVNDRTASAKLTAKWGIDFMHLSKVDGHWKIMNIMWQSHSAEQTSDR